MTAELRQATAAVLAGGLGTRLRGVVPDGQKALASVGGAPFLHRVLAQLEAAGVRAVVLCTGYMADQVERELGAQFGAMQIGYSRESTPLGTAGALRHALPLLQSDPLLVLNGDSYCDLDLTKLWLAHREAGALGTLALVQVPDASRYGRVETTREDRVSAFLEKTGRPEPAWVNAGVYVLARSLIAGLPTGAPLSLETDLLARLTQGELSAWRCGGRFIDIGTPESFAQAQRFFAAEGAP